MSCSPTGSPSESPQGIDSAGSPARLDGIVQTSERYIASGSWVRSPSRKATVGEVGETITSTRSKAALEVAPDQRAHPLGAQVVGVVVARGQGEGAEHHAPLHLGAEARAAGRS